MNSSETTPVGIGECKIVLRTLISAGTVNRSGPIEPLPELCVLPDWRQQISQIRRFISNNQTPDLVIPPREGDAPTFSG